MQQVDGLSNLKARSGRTAKKAATASTEVAARMPPFIEHSTFVSYRSSAIGNEESYLQVCVYVVHMIFSNIAYTLGIQRKL